MNWHHSEGNWKQYRGKSNQQWRVLAYTQKQIDDKREEAADVIQEASGISTHSAEWELSGVGSSASAKVELVESYFSDVRKGKRVRGAAGKVSAFGLIKRGGRVFTVMITNTHTATLLPIMEQMILPDSIIYTSGFKGDDAGDVCDL